MPGPDSTSAPGAGRTAAPGPMAGADTAAAGKSLVAPAALLLTGGSSRRMGRNKATLEVAGGQLAVRTAALLVQVADPVIEVGPGYTALAHVEEEPVGSGPLAAVAAGAAAIKTGQPALVVATDLPRLTVAFLRRLAGEEGPTVDHCVVPRDAGGRAQPLCARYSASALARAAELVANGHRSMNDLLERVPVIFIAVPADMTDALLDIDTPADLADLAPPGSAARPTPTPAHDLGDLVARDETT